MNNLIIYFKKYSKILKIINLSLLLGLIISFLIYKRIDNTSILSELTNLKDFLSNNHLNYILFHFIVISILIISSLTIIGSIVFIIYFLFEGISIGYNILTLFHIYHLKGILYSFFYILFTKAIFIILLILLFIKVLNILKIIITKKEINFKESIHHNLKGIILIIILIFLNDLLIFIFGSSLLSKLLFIIS